MAAVTTKKRNGDMAVQLTFPTVFEDVYAEEGLPLEYEHESMPALPALPEGTDLQADYHRQKQADANRMAMAGVQASANAERRFLLSHAGYYGMPKPVLGQRIYANPSNGNQADIYPARRDQGEGMTGAGLVGGVLRTAEGQNYGRQLLQARAAQLDAIDAAMDMQMPDSSRLPPVAQDSFAEPLGEVPTNVMLELTTMIEGFVASIMSGRLSTIDIKDAVRAVQLILRVAPSLGREEFEGLLEQVENLVEQTLEIYLDAVDGPDEDDAAKGLHQTVRVIFPLYDRVLRYLRVMSSAKNINRPVRERVALSKALVKKFELANIVGAQEQTYERNVARPRRAADAARAAERADLPADAEFVAFGKMHGGAQRARRATYAVAPMSSTFSQPAPTREDSEHAGQGSRNTVHFTRDQRQVFGDRSGAYFGEGPAGDYSATPGMTMATPSEANMNPFRQVRDNTMQQPAQAPLPVFPKGTPDATAAEIDAMATQMQGKGKAKKWIQGVAESMKKGAFTKQALRAHMTPEQFADEVLAHPDKYSMVTRRRAQFLKNIRRGGMDAKHEVAPGAGAAAAAAREMPAWTKLSEAELDKLKEKNARAAKLAKRRAEAAEAEDSSKAASMGRFLKLQESGRKATAKELAMDARRATYGIRPFGEMMEEREGAFGEEVKGRVAKRKEAAAAKKPSAPKGKSHTMARDEATAEGRGKAHGITRASLPKTREGYMQLAQELKGMGHTMRINKDSKLSSIRQNFIRKLGL
jgi:hypothetical protein